MAKSAKTRKAPRTVTFKIPGELYTNIQRLIQGTGFRSPTEFAIHVLRDVCAGGRLDQKSPTLRKTDLDAVHARLRALGYIE